MVNEEVSLKFDCLYAYSLNYTMSCHIFALITINKINF